MSRLVRTLARNQISHRPDFQHIRNIGDKILFDQFKKFVEGIESKLICMGFEEPDLEWYKHDVNWPSNDLYHILEVMHENDVDYWLQHFSGYIPKLFEGARIYIKVVQASIDNDPSSQEVNSGFEPKNIPIEKGYADLTMKVEGLFDCLMQNFGKIPEAIRNELKEFNVTLIFNEDIDALDKEIVDELNYAKKSLWFNLENIPEHIKL
ncbi:hypothetical protein H4219_005396 [Mycoemilia scoparia]|uniref:Uncharacterized protein n=1 Tax=Mycoemilia scoparia TaxID=417184 RepID=A0A9W7ZT80_9FUNG|nr:hypothetical protein H4219_005396 [Mycoemilia scoparia]